MASMEATSVVQPQPLDSIGRRLGALVLIVLISALVSGVAAGCGTPYFTVWVDNQTDIVVYVEVIDDLLNYKTMHASPPGTMGTATNRPGNDFRGATGRVLSDECTEIAVVRIDTLMSGIVLDRSGRVSVVEGTPPGLPTAPGLPLDEATC